VQKIGPREDFQIHSLSMASDGLWDCLSFQRVYTYGVLSRVKTRRSMYYSTHIRHKGGYKGGISARPLTVLR
jgi:hypothetical protein